MSRANCRAVVSPRRPARVPSSRAYTALATTPTAPVPTSAPEQTLKERLEQLLSWLPRVVDRTADQVEKEERFVPEHVRRLFSKDGPLGILQFWRENEHKIKNTGEQIRETGEQLVKGDANAFRIKAAGIDFSWLLPRNQEQPAHDGLPLAPAVVPLERRLLNALEFAVDSLSPWDFDRHDFGLTFTNVWDDVEPLPAVDGTGAIVKMTSTMKLLEREWKLSARTKLLEIGEGGVVFGKAGLYLAGNLPAYVGVEADRVWKIPGLPGTKAFVNVNYRSSRKPDLDPVLSTVGIQQTFPLVKGFDLCLRVGTNMLERKKFFVTPVPNGSYF